MNVISLATLILSLAFSSAVMAEENQEPDPFADGITMAIECKGAYDEYSLSRQQGEAAEFSRNCFIYAVAVLQTIGIEDGYSANGKPVCLSDNVVPTLLLLSAAGIAEQEKEKSASAKATYAEIIIEAIRRNYPCTKK